VVALLTLGGACARPAQPLVLASTTSTEDSGLFDVLLPAFRTAHPEHTVRLVAVGSGQALELGERGDADVLLVHSPDAEQHFMAAGHGVARRPVMYNDFVLVGPATDPAGIRGLDPAAALRRIAESGAAFISRGDDSGTHARERALWAAAGIDPQGQPWYMDVGQGMGETLAIAGERRGYTLSDRGTYLSLIQRDALEVLVEKHDQLYNPYTVIVVGRARNARGARAFADWITSPSAQQLIARYGTARFGQPLFVPDAPVR
jgi:tungstate transport system substrate-binding protein